MTGARAGLAQILESLTLKHAQCIEDLADAYSGKWLKISCFRVLHDVYSYPAVKERGNKSLFKGIDRRVGVAETKTS